MEIEIIRQESSLAVHNAEFVFQIKKIQVKKTSRQCYSCNEKVPKDDKKILAKQALNPAAFDNILRLNEGYWVHRKLTGSPANWENVKRMSLL